METFMGRLVHHSKPTPTGVLAPQQAVAPMGGIASPDTALPGVASPSSVLPIVNPGMAPGAATPIPAAKF